MSLLDDKLFVFIVGGPEAVRGCGKTSLLVKIVKEHMVGAQAAADLEKCRKRIEKYRAGGWSNMSLEPHVRHLVYAVDDTFNANNMGYGEVYSMELEFARLGLFDGYKQVAYLLPYSIVAIPEVQSKLDSRKSTKGVEGLSDNLGRFIELQRKFGIRMIADAQFYGSVEKRLRESADLIIEVQGQSVKKNQWRGIESVSWDCLEFDGAARYERYQETHSMRLARRIRYVERSDIFTNYDSLAGHEYFVNGMTGNFHTQTAQPSSHDRNAMQEKCQKFPVVRPKQVREAANGN
jgi:hypothetical protein